MKILNVIGELGYGGAELLTIELGKRFVSNGDSVMLLISGYCTKSVADKATKSGLELRYLNSNSFSLKNIIQISRIIRQNNFDIIHAHLFPAFYLIALCSLWSNHNIKFIYTEHSTSNRRRRYKFFKLIERPIYSAFHKIFYETQNIWDAQLI